uniref:Uncharacterized protein n=1 Tax=Clastoptera arizonana TaxID=38151 RepID=A0A1B6DGS9_9HEMI
MIDVIGRNFHTHNYEFIIVLVQLIFVLFYASVIAASVPGGGIKKTLSMLKVNRCNNHAIFVREKSSARLAKSNLTDAELYNIYKNVVDAEYKVFLNINSHWKKYDNLKKEKKFYRKIDLALQKLDLIRGHTNRTITENLKTMKEGLAIVQKLRKDLVFDGVYENLGIVRHLDTLI